MPITRPRYEQLLSAANNAQQAYAARQAEASAILTASATMSDADARTALATFAEMVALTPLAVNDLVTVQIELTHSRLTRSRNERNALRMQRNRQQSAQRNSPQPTPEGMTAADVLALGQSTPQQVGPDSDGGNE